MEPEAETKDRFGRSAADYNDAVPPDVSWAPRRPPPPPAPANETTTRGPRAPEPPAAHD